MAKHENKDVHTMIGADAVIQGNITCQGGVAVYGKVFGDVTSEAQFGLPEVEKFMEMCKPMIPTLAVLWMAMFVLRIAQCLVQNLN